MKKQWMKAFWQDEKGGVAIFIGLTIVVLVVVSGIAIDYTRSAMIHQRIQYASDPASVAGALLPSGTPPGERVAVATRYFQANYPQNYLGIARPAPAIFDEGGGRVRATGTLQVANTFMPVNNGPNVNQVNSTALAGRATNKKHIVLVADTSRIMRSTACAPQRINCYQNQLASMANALAACVGNTCSQDVKVAVVGYKASPVNNFNRDGTRTYDFTSNVSRPTNGLLGPFCRPPRPERCSATCTQLGNVEQYIFSDLTHSPQSGCNENSRRSYGDRAMLRARNLLNLITENTSKIVIVVGDGYNRDAEDECDGSVSCENNPSSGFGNNYNFSIGAQMLQNCTAMKNSGVKIYTILFGPSKFVNGPSTPQYQVMRDCATSPAEFFTAVDSTGLANARQQIVAREAPGGGGRIRLLE